MNLIINNLSLASVSLLCAWLFVLIVFHLPKCRQLNVEIRFVLALVVFFSVRYIPIINNFSLAYILRGILGDLSITTFALLLVFIYGEISGNNDYRKTSKFVWGSIFVIGVILYLATIGCIPIDIYAFGYSPKGLLLFYLAMQLLLWRYSRKMAFIWLLALIGFSFQILPSPNLWDYLLDPILWLISLIFLLFA